jgi:hypothetical protein
MYSDALVAVSFSGRPISCSTRESRRDARGERSRLDEREPLRARKARKQRQPSPRATGWTDSRYPSTRSRYSSTSASAEPRRSPERLDHVNAQLVIEGETIQSIRRSVRHVTVERPRQGIRNAVGTESA